MLELSIEHVQGHVHEQGGQDPTLRGAGESPFELTRLRHHPGSQERPDERKDLSVAHSPLDLGHQGPAVHAVEARLDVELGHPVVGVVAEDDDLGDGVLGPATGSPAVGGGVEVGLEDRLAELGLHLFHPLDKVDAHHVCRVPDAEGRVRGRVAVARVGHVERRSNVFRGEVVDRRGQEGILQVVPRKETERPADQRGHGAVLRLDQVHPAELGRRAIAEAPAQAAVGGRRLEQLVPFIELRRGGRPDE